MGGEGGSVKFSLGWLRKEPRLERNVMDMMDKYGPSQWSVTEDITEQTLSDDEGQPLLCYSDVILLCLLFTSGQRYYSKAQS